MTPITGLPDDLLNKPIITVTQFNPVNGMIPEVSLLPFMYSAVESKSILKITNKIVAVIFSYSHLN